MAIFTKWKDHMKKSLLCNYLFGMGSKIIKTYLYFFLILRSLLGNVKKVFGSITLSLRIEDRAVMINFGVLTMCILFKIWDLIRLSRVTVSGESRKTKDWLSDVGENTNNEVNALREIGGECDILWVNCENERVLTMSNNIDKEIWLIFMVRLFLTHWSEDNHAQFSMFTLFNITKTSVCHYCNLKNLISVHFLKVIFIMKIFNYSDL